MSPLSTAAPLRGAAAGQQAVHISGPPDPSTQICQLHSCVQVPGARLRAQKLQVRSLWAPRYAFGRSRAQPGRWQTARCQPQPHACANTALQLPPPLPPPPPPAHRPRAPTCAQMGRGEATRRRKRNQEKAALLKGEVGVQCGCQPWCHVCCRRHQAANFCRSASDALLLWATLPRSACRLHQTRRSPRKSLEMMVSRER